MAFELHASQATALRALPGWYQDIVPVPGLKRRVPGPIALTRSGYSRFSANRRRLWGCPDIC